MVHQDPTFWVLIAFILFIMAIFKPAKKEVVGVVDAYRDDVMRHITEAKDTLDQARAEFESQQRLYQQVMTQIKEIQEHARHEREVIEQTYQKRADQFFEARTRSLEQRVAYLRVKFERDVEKHVMERAIILAENALFKHAQASADEANTLRRITKAL